MKLIFKIKTFLLQAYVTPGNENQLKILCRKLERHRGKNIILLGDSSSRSNTWDKIIQQQNRMGQLLEDIINRPKLHITTKLPYTFKRSNNTGKSTLDLTLVRSLKNVQAKVKEFELIKSGHLAIEVLIEDTQNNLKH